MARVLVTEKLAERGLELLRDAGHEVEVREGLSPDDLIGAVAGANALVVRSATKVTAGVLAAGTDLVIVGRAGVGLDNVDVRAATERGIMVANAPTSNILSVAELAMGLLLAQARHIPQAHASLVGGRWERSRWEGVELHGKVLGIVGLGRAGSFVAQRATAFGMRVVGHDPHLTPERARSLGIELRTLEELFSESDFVTLHVPKTAETMGMVSRELLSKAKKGIRIVNTARGGIVDEDALAEAIRSGTVAGASLDVFATEPPGESPLLELEQVVVTPHLGASTAEAQEKAGMAIAEQVCLALAGEFVPYAVNLSASEAPDAVRPFMGVVEHLGAFFACLHEGIPDELVIESRGELASQPTDVLTLCALKGFFSVTVEEPVSFVNAPQIAETRGLKVDEVSAAPSTLYRSLVTLRSGTHTVSGTLGGSGARLEPRIVMVDGHSLEIPPAEHMLVVRNDDRPGMIGAVGTALGAAGVSISSMAVGPNADGHSALMVLSTDLPTPRAVVEELRREDGIVDVHAVKL